MDHFLNFHIEIFSHDEGNGLLAQDSVIFINTIGENRISIQR